MVLITLSTPRAFEFACQSKACAPPPAGRGGSSKGGGSGGAGTIKASDLKRGDKVMFGQQVKQVSSTGVQGNGKVGISFTSGGSTDLKPGQTLPRATGKVGRSASSGAPKEKFADRQDQVDSYRAASRNKPRDLAAEARYGAQGVDVAAHKATVAQRQADKAAAQREAAMKGAAEYTKKRLGP